MSKLLRLRRYLPVLPAVVLLWFCVENLARVVLSVQQMRALPDLPTSIQPGYLAATGAVWLIAFAAALAAVARRARRAARFSLAVMALYQGYLWFNRLALSRSSEAVETLGFRAILTAVSLLLLAGALLAAGYLKEAARGA